MLLMLPAFLGTRHRRPDRRPAMARRPGTPWQARRGARDSAAALRSGRHRQARVRGRKRDLGGWLL